MNVTYNTSQTNRSTRVENPNKLFIKDIPHGITTEQMLNLCQNFGQVLDCVLTPSRANNKFQTAKVSYQTPNEAHLAIQHINNINEEGIKLHASLLKEFPEHQSSDTVLIAQNLPLEFEIEDLKTLFSTYGAIKNINIKIDPKHNKTGFVHYQDPISAKQAMSELQNLQLSENSKPIVLKFAKLRSQEALNDKLCSDSKSVLLTNIPCDWDETIFSTLLQEFGFVDSVRIDVNQKLRKKAALIVFGESNSAREAVKKLSGLIVDNKNRALTARLVKETKTSGPQIVSEKICKYHQWGYCFRGDKCWFSHSIKRRNNPFSEANSRTTNGVGFAGQQRRQNNFQNGSLSNGNVDRNGQVDERSSVTSAFDSSGQISFQTRRNKL